MILEDVQGKFLNWANQNSFTGKFVGIENITVKGESTKMAVFEKGNDTYYVGNFQILRILEHNIDRGILSHELKISLQGSITTKTGNEMLKFQVETTEKIRDVADATKETPRTPGVPF